ncbi:MAG TPA: OmpA family protein [Chromatiaceae bacterium]|jgi:OOP family OmpA-OmpF porin|nr:MAG: OmpA family protein [Thiohalocapsa sp. PB-PSB1]HBG96867.1 OmpA family protein [Chromatiaceae bacterium]HCS92943.1 OmpA family protein [Chromatiaceae bacterium]
MSTISSSRTAALALAAALGLGLSAHSSFADEFGESYWYAAGDPTVPNGQLWVNSAGECWQSSYPDGPTNLPPCQVEVPAEITVNLNFEFDEFIVPDTVVNPEELVKIDEYIDQVKATPVEEYVTIVGHTDAKGSDEYNMQLGLRRADAVRNYFIAQGYPERNLAPAETEGKRDLLPDVDPFSVLQRRVVITKTDS